MRLPTQEPSHWVSGFIRVLDDTLIEISNSQDSGRVEILQGKMNNCTDAGYELDFASIALSNDPITIETSRIFKLANNTLACSQSMATNTTAQAIVLPHLHSILTKVE